MSPRPCIIVPCYNHGSTLQALIERLAPFGLPLIIVDDGSDEATASELRRLAAQHALTLLAHSRNQGKGAAVATALREARRLGHTHALQIDADGQHDVSAIPALLDLSRANPDALVSGRPVYDSSIPPARRIGRWITHVWVWIETLSLEINDSMCGLRVYPVSPSLVLLDSPRLRVGRRMDFDTEIMVRLHWAGHPVLFHPVRVTYPPGGVSHFRAFRDNLRISWMHTRLFLGMLPRAPKLLWRKLKTERETATPHWSRIPERRGLAGMRLMLLAYRVFGYRFFSLLLHPVVFVFWLTGARARRASRDWLRRLRARAAATGRVLPDRPPLTGYRHFYRFGESILEKLAAWNGDIRNDDVEIVDHGVLAPYLKNHDAPGALVFMTHLGNPELCRALGARTGKTINAIVHTANAARFNRLLRETAPGSHLNLIPAAGLSPATAILLREKLDAGEWIAIAADRTSIHHPGRVVMADLLGAPAPFPEGPFVLASVLKCPVFLMFALKENGRHRIHVEPFADPLALPRATRAAALSAHAARLAARLEHHAMNAPLDWFNFHNFWPSA